MTDELQTVDALLTCKVKRKRGEVGQNMNTQMPNQGQSFNRKSHILDAAAILNKNYINVSSLIFNSIMDALEQFVSHHLQICSQFFYKAVRKDTMHSCFFTV